MVGEVQTELNLEVIDRKGSIYQHERQKNRARSKSPSNARTEEKQDTPESLYNSVLVESLPSWENNPARNRKIEREMGYDGFIDFEQ